MLGKGSVCGSVWVLVHPSRNTSTRMGMNNNCHIVVFCPYHWLHHCLLCFRVRYHLQTPPQPTRQSATAIEEREVPSWWVDDSPNGSVYLANKYGIK